MTGLNKKPSGNIFPDGFLLHYFNILWKVRRVAHHFVADLIKIKVEAVSDPAALLKKILEHKENDQGADRQQKQVLDGRLPFRQNLSLVSHSSPPKAFKYLITSLGLSAPKK